MLENYPSRMPIYDSQFKTLSINKKFDEAYSIISRLGFCPSTVQLGQKYEQSFTREININGENAILNLRLQPNLHCTIYHYTINGQTTIHKGFFEYKRIFTKLGKLIGGNLKQSLRDILIEKLLTD